MATTVVPTVFTRPSVTSRLLAWAARALDVRRGEGGLVVLSFVVLLLTISAHTMLETARDTLLLAKMPRRSLGIVYVLIAVFTLPTGAIAAAMAKRWGPKRALSGSLVVAALSVLGVRALPAGANTAMTLYVLTGLIGAVLVPQFWAFAGGLFTVTQGRRLLGPIASAGVIGGFVGSGLAAVAVRMMPTRQLLLVAGAIFLVAAGRILTTRVGDEPLNGTALENEKKASMFSRDAMADVRRDPFVLRIAGLVTLSTATVLALDYLFKWSVAESVPPERLGRYLATYYAIVNGVSLVMQLFVGGALVRRLGVTSAALVTPMLLAGASVGMAVFGGAHRAVMLAKGADGALRHSVHRITTELVYLPVNATTRARVKPFIDGALARFAQAITACLLLAMAETGRLSRWHMTAFICVLAFAWLALAANTRKPYLEIFRRAITRDSTLEQGTRALDFATVEMLVERLSNPKAEEVVAAMRVLEARGRERLVPALILYHPEPRVLVHAIEVFSASDRTDWMLLAEGLVTHTDETVRMAALRALCRRGRVDLLKKMAATDQPRIRAYVNLWLAVRAIQNERERESLPPGAPPPPPPSTRGVPPSEAFRDEDATAVWEGTLAAIADAPQLPELGDMLLQFLDAGLDVHALPADALETATDYLDLLALAVANQADPRTIPRLVPRLAFRVGRDAIRGALVRLGQPGFDAVANALRDPRSPRQLRIHLPRTLGRFGTPEAAQVLLRVLEEDRDGLVRYKAIRGLGALAGEHHVRVEPRRVERFAYDNLVEYLRLLGLGVGLERGFDPASATNPRRAFATMRFLDGLLEDKMRQALERAFRLLKIAYPKEDIHGVHIAATSSDKRARANASEFLDTLLTRKHERRLRAILCIIIDDVTGADRVDRATAFLASPAPRDHRAAIVELSRDRDAILSAIALDHARAFGDPQLLGRSTTARGDRGEVDPKTRALASSRSVVDA